MRVTSGKNHLVNIEGIEFDEMRSFINMVKGASLEDRRVWSPVVREIGDKPLDKIPLADSLVLAKEVKEMRRLQRDYFKVRSRENLMASIAQERKVDDLVNEMLNRL